MPTYASTVRQLRQLPRPPHPPRRRAPRARFGVLLVLLAATGLSACGGGGNGSAAAGTPAAAATATATATATPAPAQKAGGTEATIAGFAFAPKQLKVKVGQEITWTNQDSAAHTVTAKSGASFDSGALAQGASFTFKATKPGTIEYFCAIHPSMTGTITVQ